MVYTTRPHLSEKSRAGDVVELLAQYGQSPGFNPQHPINRCGGACLQSQHWAGAGGAKGSEKSKVSLGHMYKQIRKRLDRTFCFSSWPENLMINPKLYH